MFKKKFAVVLFFMMIVGLTSGCDNTSTALNGAEETVQSQETKSVSSFSLTEKSYYYVADNAARAYSYDVRYQGAMEYEAWDFYDTTVLSAVYGGWYTSGEGFLALKVIKDNPYAYSIVHNIEFVYEGEKIVSKIVQLGSQDIIALNSPKADPSELDGISSSITKPAYLWTKTSQQGISWARGGKWNGVDVSIWLYNAQSKVKFLITPSTANDGAYSWTVSSNVPYSQETESFSWQVKIMKPVAWMGYTDNTYLGSSNSSVENFFDNEDNLFSTSVSVRITD